MNTLLDTHSFLWWVTDDPQLSPRVRNILEDGANTIYFSSAIAWEIAIKTQIGKLSLPDLPARFISEQIALHGFEELPITTAHALQIYTLPLLHRDPFDRVLVTQCQVEGFSILTTDSLIAQYGVSTIW